MIAAFFDIRAWADVSDTTSAPKPPKPHAPLLIGDILTMRGHEPEFLIRWRQDRETLDRETLDRD